MKILFYGAKPYDTASFDAMLPAYPGLELKYIEANLLPETAPLARGYEAVCAFVNADLGAAVIDILADCGVKLILLRCAGYNHVDLKAAQRHNIPVLRVPGYSPEAVAEHAMALALTANRHTHKAYIKCRENNFALNGLTGVNLHGKTAGIVGTGQIGLAMARICRGFGMEVLAYDPHPKDGLDWITYVPLEELLRRSDLISLHCPLTRHTRHLINQCSIALMKDGVILVNTSRGGLICTEDLISGIRDHKFFAVGLDVYEEETDYVFEDLSGSILQTLHRPAAALLSQCGAHLSPGLPDPGGSGEHRPDHAGQTPKALPAAPPWIIRSPNEGCSSPPSPYQGKERNSPWLLQRKKSFTKFPALTPASPPATASATSAPRGPTAG